MRAGIAIIEGVRRLNTIAGPLGTLSSRIGIASGLVVVGDLIGFGSSLESAAVGDTPNLAARLQTAADVNTVVICESTWRLAGGLFEYRELNLGILKGRHTLQRAWAVLRESAIDSRFDALRPDHRPLIGRSEELELLLRRWEQAKTGDGRVVLICGDSGIGKSRLVAALEQKLINSAPTCLRFFCSSHYRDTPLFPLMRQIERVLGFQPGDSSAVKREKLQSTVPSDTSLDDIDLLFDLLSISEASTAPTMPVTPQRRREMTFAAIVRQLERLTGRAPILLILEDLHWADPTTLDLLVLLIDSAERLPLLLVLTTRLDGSPPAWSSRSNVTVQLLNGLDRQMATSLVREIAGRQTPPEAVVHRIISHADGVPLYIEELTKTVLEGRQKNGESAAPIEPLLPSVVPTSLNASLMARLDRLPLGKEIAQTASVIGREFSFRDLLALSQLPPKQIERSLGELVNSGLIIARGEPPNATYVFKHALVQDAAYASLLRERRRVIHGRLAEFLEAESGAFAMSRPELVAWHFAEAGLADRAIDNYLRAADRTTGRFAIAEMVSYLRHALGQLRNLPDSTATMRRELALLVALGRALIDHQGSGSEEVRTTFERARKVSLDLRDPNQLIRVHDGLLNFHFTHSEPDEILRNANELLDVGQRFGSPQALLMASRSAGFAHLLSGLFTKARDEMQLFLGMYEVERDGPGAALTTRDPKVSVCTMLGMCLTALGYSEAGAAASLAGIKHAETLNHPISLILSLRRACVQGMMQRDHRGVFDLSNRLLAITSEYETFKGTRDGTIFHCWAQFHTNPNPALLESMQDCLNHFDSTKHWALLPFFIASTAELRGDAGDIAGAAELLERAAELVKITGEQWCQAEITRLQARFSARDPDDAFALLFASLEKARSQCAKLWEARTAISLAEMWRDNGDKAAAQEVLGSVYGWFSEGLDNPDLVNARALLNQLNGR
jgi:AAA ATPase domain/Adenylate and Guanylate cyclase catalytic domain